MSLYAALALYPLWAVSVLFAATALRLGRARGLGLVSLSGCMALWVSGLIMLEHPETSALAERVLPAGMLLAGSFVHAGVDVVGGSLSAGRRRSLLIVAYGFGIVVAAVGATSPGLYLAPGLSGPGPLFWPLFAVGALGSVVTIAMLAREAIRAPADTKRRAWAITIGCVTGTIAGGVAVAAEVLGYGSIRLAGPVLYPSIGLVTFAVLDAQPRGTRALFRRTLGYGLITGAVSAIGLPLFVLLAPSLTPSLAPGPSLLWLALVSFSAALPLDALRNLVVEGVGRRIYRDPIGVPDLAQKAEESESRAEHAEALAQIGTMASAVAHEMRNPLGVIQAHAKLLEKTGARADSVAALRTQVDRSKRFLDDLLRYAKPKPIERERVSVRAAVDKALAEVRTRHSSGPEVDIDVDEDLRVEADPHALQDVLIVLITNAFAALADRGDGRITIDAERRKAGVELRVGDDGPGVPDELQDRLFAPFVSGRGRDHKFPGTGLGLAIAARWLERHRGTIRFEPSPLPGARFVMWWPDA